MKDFTLTPPAKVEKPKCEKAQAYLRWDDLPTTIEESGDVAKVWWMYKPDMADDFKFFLCIPIYEVWGAKKRKKYLENRDGH